MAATIAASTSGKTIMIDNYDSFTWNVYGVLVQLGADVEVFRNDSIDIAGLRALNPKNIVISPGPGHPRDAGISLSVVREFGGVVPILGVCLGEQCMFEAYGGTVAYAGEIVHGKTSPISHDGKGLYKGVSQGIEATRYHSLAGDRATLPNCLEITSTTPSGVIMGVRHKTFVMEGVQYHPESIASEEGIRLLANFLSWEGGHWDSMIERPIYAPTPKGQRKRETGGAVGSGIPISKISKLNSTGTTTNSTLMDTNISVKKSSILETIKDRRIQDVNQIRNQPGFALTDLQDSLALGLAPAQIDFGARLRFAQPNVAVLAEIKRASPSKGPIDMSTHAPSQAVLYATSGAAAISVLTEPVWFKGALEDMRLARLAVDKIANRPAILRKDFVVDEYQVYEARLAGADTVLLIVAILLEDGVLRHLINVSRSLGMEPLVEVANADEMKIAVDVGAKIIGVNNRDLHTFTVDMSRTSNLASMVPEGTILIALSGITGRSDVEKYISAGAVGVLVGEHLMKSADKHAFIRDLIGLPTPMDVSSPSNNTVTLVESAATAAISPPFVKICAITNESDALVAAKSGADFIGLIFAKSPRQVTTEQAKRIIEAVRQLHQDQETTSKKLTLPSLPTTTATNVTAKEWYTATHNHLKAFSHESKRPLFVGVFSNTLFEEINQIVRETGLDIVQLHGDEDPKLVAPLICAPIIKAFHVHAGDTASDVAARIGHGRGVLLGALLDTGVKGVQQQGGSGVAFDWEIARAVGREHGIPIWVAGGLDAGNVRTAVGQIGAAGVDVASGVEGSVKGKKDHGKVELFVLQAKQG
ncbi:bifunctional tryptophan synthase trp1 [Physocladia obscura]|uniref:Multifunctional tryptophan biosynthesis protein n=1 Tax=Physocladia obscura TaxID=109957 RepID=A0AAD5T1G1_9FUNG|nr:bifunctional tryptophan synthase trp1 [Physocladia obscura]